MSWLPLYHDMGLIGGLLARDELPRPARADRAGALPGAPRALAARHRPPPRHHLRRAELRVRLRRRPGEGPRPRGGSRSRAGGSRSTAPSRSPARRCAASPTRFERHGFDPAALRPGVRPLRGGAGGHLRARAARCWRARRVDPVAARARRRGGRPATREIVSVGAPVPGVEVEVRGEGGAPLEEARLGRIWVRGPSLMRGYLGDPAATARGGPGRLARHRRPRLRPGRRAVRARPRQGRGHRARREPRAGRVRGAARARAGRCAPAARWRSASRRTTAARRCWCWPSGPGTRTGTTPRWRAGSAARCSSRPAWRRTRSGSSPPGRSRGPAPGSCGGRRRCAGSWPARSSRRGRSTSLRLAHRGGALAARLRAGAAARVSSVIERARAAGSERCLTCPPPRRVVVGGGPAGLAFAAAAAARGLDVAVLERRAGALDKACGEGILPAGVRALEALGVLPRARPRRRLAAPRAPLDRRRRRRGPDRAAGAGRPGRPAHRALRRAPGAGARGRRRDRRGGRGGRRTGASAGCVQVGLAGGEARAARIVVAADGLASPTRRREGLDRPVSGPPRFGLRRHFARAPWADAVEVHFGAGAEAYVTPCGAGRVGVAFLFERGAGGRFEDLLARFPAAPGPARGRAAGLRAARRGAAGARGAVPHRRPPGAARRRGRLPGRRHRRGALARLRLRPRPRRAAPRGPGRAARRARRSRRTRPPGAAASAPTPPGPGSSCRSRATPRSAGGCSRWPPPRRARSSGRWPRRSVRVDAGRPPWLVWRRHVEARSSGTCLTRLTGSPLAALGVLLADLVDRAIAPPTGSCRIRSVR